MRLLQLIRHVYRRSMPAPRDPKDLTPDDLDTICDMALEDHTGKPVNKGSDALNIEALEKRIAMLQDELQFLNTSPLSESNPELCADMMMRNRKAIVEADRLIASLKDRQKQRN